MRVLVPLLVALVLAGCAVSDNATSARPSPDTAERKGPDFKRGTY